MVTNMCANGYIIMYHSDVEIPEFSDLITLLIFTGTLSIGTA